MAEISGTWKCISVQDSENDKLLIPEKMFVEIRNVKIFDRLETHIDIADYSESLLLKGNISKVTDKMLMSSMTVDITFPEKIQLQCDFSVANKYLKMTWHGKSSRTLKMALEKQEEHLF